MNYSYYLLLVTMCVLRTEHWSSGIVANHQAISPALFSNSFYEVGSVINMLNRLVERNLKTQAQEILKKIVKKKKNLTKQ